MRFNVISKLVMLIVIIFFTISTTSAQNGPYIRFSLGVGLDSEFQTLKANMFGYGVKNHAIGWGFKDKYAVFFHDFGADSKIDIGEKYHYIKLDAYGLGFSYRTPKNINFHFSGGYSTLHFSDSYKKQGDFIEEGYAISLGVDKKWVLTKRFDVGIGPVFSFHKFPKYTFTNIGICIWIDFNFFKQNSFQKK